MACWANTTGFTSVARSTSIQIGAGGDQHDHGQQGGDDRLDRMDAPRRRRIEQRVVVMDTVQSPQQRTAVMQAVAPVLDEVDYDDDDGHLQRHDGPQRQVSGQQRRRPANRRPFDGGRRQQAARRIRKVECPQSGGHQQQRQIDADMPPAFGDRREREAAVRAFPGEKKSEEGHRRDKQGQPHAEGRCNIMVVRASLERRARQCLRLRQPAAAHHNDQRPDSDFGQCRR
jgi:hypothetical protein